VTWQWVEEAEALELHLEAASLPELLVGATTALGERLRGAGQGEPDRLPVLVESADEAGIVANFLDDLVYLADIESFAADRVERLEIVGAQVRAAVSGRSGPTSPFARGAGYPVVTLSREEADWRAHVVFPTAAKAAGAPDRQSA
jgi:SHS2 domain-containing protein